MKKQDYLLLNDVKGYERLYPHTSGMKEEIEAAKKWGIQVVQMNGKEKAAPCKEACR